MSFDSQATANLYIDNKLVATNSKSRIRSDVLSAYPNKYGGTKSNTIPGYIFNYDTSNLTLGTHTISVKVQNRYGQITYEYPNQTITITN